MIRIPLSLIRYQIASAPQNMAIDEQLLTHADRTHTAYLRFYGWEQNSLTFGYSQSWDSVRSLPHLPFAEIPLENRIRRMTGGGIVDHRNDITYAIAIPLSHPSATQQASRFYEQLHQALKNALETLHLKTALQPCPCDTATPKTPKSPASLQSQCFVQPEPYDLIVPQSGQKIAGAALKRNRQGLLTQGSIAKGALPPIELNAFARMFQKALAKTFEFEAILDARLPIPEPSSDRYASTEWNTKR